MDSADRQLGYLWGAGVLAFVLMAPFAGLFLERIPVCPLKLAVGVPCGTCGTTRAIVALGQLDIGGALRLNPFVTVSLLLWLGGGFWAASRALKSEPLPELPRRLHWSLKLGLVATFGLNWLYLLRAGT